MAAKIVPLIMAGGSLLLLTVTDPVNYWLQLFPGLILFGLGLGLGGGCGGGEPSGRGY